ncbi:cyanophycinase [Pedobacter chinensis]|uniref:Cyanophycinase n=1 Tax=Pedobacter chinensis TaxID=2282421 RepID=A0A369PV45_9SPHI|nr:cyanophycinase [Pedobacter chinensis]RDC55115.1 cyanophycinase [Pedobacter chinensis]
MKQLLIVLLMAFCISSLGCGKSDNPTPGTGDGGTIPPTTPVAKKRPASIGIVGDSSNVVKATNGGMVLMGGGTDVDAAFKWMIERSGGGDVVILRATGTDAYNPYVNGLGSVNSVETLLINTKELANNDTVAYIIRNAEMVFIAGGDQSDYMKYWKGTKTEQALNYLLNDKKAPVGGTSAGCAILGGFYYSGETGGLTSAQALANPYDTNVTLYNNDFLKAPYLQNVITDQHYLTRDREGRSVVFLGRINKDWKVPAKCIAADERTAVCIDNDGKAQVFGDYAVTRPYSYAYFIISDAGKQPEQMEPYKKTIWNNGEKAVSVYEIPASVNGGGNFNVANFKASEATGGKWYWWWIDNGVLNKKDQ